MPGHSLIIPKNHIISVMELTDIELSEMILFSRDITNLLLEAFSTDAFNWSLQDQEVAGQTVAHLHLHLVPRYKGDLPEPGDWYPKIIGNFDNLLDSLDRVKLTDDQISGIIGRLQELSKKKEFNYRS